MEEEYNDNLMDFIKKDNEAVKNIESLHMKEEEYGEYLACIEYNIALSYSENPKIKDKQVSKMLKNIKRNYSKGINYFEEEIEKRILSDLADIIEEDPITEHEFKLLFSYINWCISNREWMEDKKAYVKWISFRLGFFEMKESTKYINDFEKKAKAIGIPEDKKDMMLFGGDNEEKSDNQEADISSVFYAKNKKEKINFLTEADIVYHFLLEEFLSELSEEGDFDTIQELYKEFVKKFPDYIPIYLIMGEIYKSKNKILAKNYIEQSLSMVDKILEIPKELRDGMKKDINKALEELK